MGDPAGRFHSRGGCGLARVCFRVTKLELTDEERQALLRLIEAALPDPKYPLSPEVEALRRVAEKLRGDEERKAR
jgi:hypothetical protein